MVGGPIQKHRIASAMFAEARGETRWRNERGRAGRRFMRRCNRWKRNSQSGIARRHFGSSAQSCGSNFRRPIRVQSAIAPPAIGTCTTARPMQRRSNTRQTGHCIAREIPDNVELPAVFVGMLKEPPARTPIQDEVARLVARERAINDSIKNADSDRACPACNYPAPRWRVTCRVCGFEMGRALKET